MGEERVWFLTGDLLPLGAKKSKGAQSCAMHRTSWRSAIFILRTTRRGVTARAGLSGASTISMKPHRCHMCSTLSAWPRVLHSRRAGCCPRMKRAGRSSTATAEAWTTRAQCSWKSMGVDAQARGLHPKSVRRRSSREVLRAMGFDLAAIHAAHSKAAKIKADLKTRPRDWLTTASEKAAEGFGVTSRGGERRSAVLRTVPASSGEAAWPRDYNRSSTIYYKDWT